MASLYSDFTKLNFGWGCAPDPSGRAYNAPPQTRKTNWGGGYPIPIPDSPPFLTPSWFYCLILDTLALRLGAWRSVTFFASTSTKYTRSVIIWYLSINSLILLDIVHVFLFVFLYILKHHYHCTVIIQQVNMKISQFKQRSPKVYDQKLKICRVTSWDQD